jgi:hypothetical protein
MPARSYNFRATSKSLRPVARCEVRAMMRRILTYQAALLYLDRHWLSDVIGGFTLGTAYLLIALWASQMIFASRPGAGMTNPAEAIPPA